jgi:hypothetical protein
MLAENFKRKTLGVWLLTNAVTMLTATSSMEYMFKNDGDF